MAIYLHLVESSQRESWLAAGLRETLDSGKPNWEWGSWFDNPGDKVAVDFGYSLYADFGESLNIFGLSKQH